MKPSEALTTHRQAIRDIVARQLARNARVFAPVAHIIEAARLARAYCLPMTQEQFAHDKKTQQAVMLNLMVIGEAVAKIGSAFPEFLDQHPEIPWKAIRGMRNRLAHGHFDVNLDTV